MNKQNDRISFAAFMVLCCILTIMLCIMQYRGVFDVSPLALTLPIWLPLSVVGIVSLVVGSFGGDE